MDFPRAITLGEVLVPGNLLRCCHPVISRYMIIPRLRVALLLCAVISGATLVTALFTEYYLGLVPCALCLVERWPYRIATFLAAFGLFLPRAWARLVLCLCILVLLGAVVTGVTHVGVEAGLWPSPLPECAGPRLQGLSIADRLARLPDKPSTPCDEPTYLIPGLPLSMATMNLLMALALTGGLSTFIVQTKRSAP